jgi:hypothetical protein
MTNNSSRSSKSKRTHQSVLQVVFVKQFCIEGTWNMTEQARKMAMAAQGAEISAAL